MTLHDLITLMILPIGTLGTNEIQYMRYTSEYISKLQIHQHFYDTYHQIYIKKLFNIVGCYIVLINSHNN